MAAKTNTWSFRHSIFKAAVNSDVQKVLDWLGPPPVDKKRINAKIAEYMDVTLIFGAALGKHSGLLSILLQFGADVDVVSAMGGTVLTELACYPDCSELARLLLEWGAEVANIPRPKDEVVRTLQKRNAMLSNLVQSELGGRRCELVNLASRSERASEPVLICPQLVATARSAMVASSVSPERCDMTDV